MTGAFVGQSWGDKSLHEPEGGTLVLWYSGTLVLRYPGTLVLPWLVWTGWSCAVTLVPYPGYQQAVDVWLRARAPLQARDSCQHPSGCNRCAICMRCCANTAVLVLRWGCGAGVLLALWRWCCTGGSLCLPLVRSLVFL